MEQIVKGGEVRRMATHCNRVLRSERTVWGIELRTRIAVPVRSDGSGEEWR